MNARALLHGLTALILSLLLLGVSSSAGIIKNLVDIWGALLSIPEYPAVALREAWHSWREETKLISQADELKRENSILRLELAKLTSQALLSFDETGKTARVTLRSPLSWWNEIRIDRGESDGLSVGAMIFNSGYLIGRVSTISKMSSWVELITSPSFMIPAVIDQTRELGVVMGDGSGFVLLRYIPSGRGTRSGMSVSTAMIDDQFPPGLPIGKISGEYPNGSDGYTTYRIEPGADMSRFFTVNY